MGAAAIAGNQRVTIATLDTEVTNLGQAVRGYPGVVELTVTQMTQETLSWLVRFQVNEGLAQQAGQRGAGPAGRHHDLDRPGAGRARAALRGGGVGGRVGLRVDCPWDARQTHASLAPHLLEEPYEALEALESGDERALREELRDVLLQVVFHARIAAERGDGTGYNIDDVADGIVDKLVPRHPQVFGDVTVSGADEVKRNWRAIKREEKKAQAERQAGAGPAVCAVRAGPHAVRAARSRAGRAAAAQGGQGGNPR